MVTTRNISNSLASLQQQKAKEIIEKRLGRADIGFIRPTPTLNAMGRLKSESTSTQIYISGSLQFVTVKDKQLIDLGYAKLGDGIFYAYKDVDLKSEDNIIVDGVYWEIEKQIEGETINGNQIYQAWIVTRIPEV